MLGSDEVMALSRDSRFTHTTLPETNIAPENGWLEYYFPFGMAYF